MVQASFLTGQALKLPYGHFNLRSAEPSSKLEVLLSLDLKFF